jgi:hypothetical protein
VNTFYQSIVIIVGVFVYKVPSACDNISHSSSSESLSDGEDDFAGMSSEVDCQSSSSESAISICI